jgi:hypothetical protein
VHRPSPPPVVVAMSTAVEELNNRESAIVTWEDGLMASEHTHQRACLEHGTERVQTNAVPHDYLTRSHARTSRTKHSLNLNRMLEER